MNQRLIAVLFAILVSSSFAYSAADYLRYDHDEVDFGHACTYYNLTSPVALTTATGFNALGIDSFNVVKGNLKTYYWEKLVSNVPVNMTVWKSNITCANMTAANSTTYQRCTENGKNVNQTVYQDQWQPLDTSAITVSSSAPMTVRFCGSYMMVNGSASIDHIPKFMGYVFNGKNGTPAYSWWNSTWNSARSINLTCSACTGGAYYINVTAPISTGVETRWTTNSSGAETECGGAWRVLNTSNYDWQLNCTLGPSTEIKMYYRNTTTVGNSTYSGIQKACLLGDEFEDGSFDTANRWTVLTGSPVETGGRLSLGTLNETVGQTKYERVNAMLKTELQYWHGSGIYQSFGFYDTDLMPNNDLATISYNSGASTDMREYDRSAVPTLTAVGNQDDGVWQFFTMKLVNNTNYTIWNSTTMVYSDGGAGVPSGGRFRTYYWAYLSVPNYIDWTCMYDVVDSQGLGITSSSWGAETNYSTPGAVNIYLNSPLNTTYNVSGSTIPIDFNASCNGSFAYYNLSFYVDSVYNSSQIIANASSGLSQPYFETVGTYNGSASCQNGSNITYTSNRTFTVLTYNPGYVSFTSLSANHWETEPNTVTALMNMTPEFITAYNYSFVYNNTVIASGSVSGLPGGTYSATQSTSFVNPLVTSNLSKTIAVYWNVSIEPAHTNFTDTSDKPHNLSQNFAVNEWYYSGSLYTLTPGAASTVETSNNGTNTLYAKPALANQNVTYTAYAFSSGIMTEVYANGTLTNVSGNETVTATNLTFFTVAATHYQKNGVISLLFHPYRSFTFNYTETPESTSSKTLTDNRYLSREYLVWLVNSTNGSITGAANLSDVFNITFYDESTLLPLGIDSAVATYTLTFSDGVNKTYYVYDSGASDIYSFSTRGYPNTTTQFLSATETFTRVNYTTRAKFFSNISTLFNTTAYSSVYLYPMSGATYLIISATENGIPRPGVYIQVLKYYSSTGAYTLINELVTNSNGQAAFYGQLDAYYKFIVYDAAGVVLYTSSQPEQFICISGTCSISISLGTTTSITFLTPSGAGSCYGVNATNSIVFDYADYTGLTKNVTFLAWRSDNNTALFLPIYNQTFSGSSMSVVYPLVAPENLSTHRYGCAIYYAASPERPFYVGLIDFIAKTSKQDYLFVMVIGVIALGTLGLNPVTGIILASLGLTIMTLLGIVPLSISSLAWLLVVAALIVKQMLPKESA